ncbi:DUF5123 domain-containing protein [Flavobacterium piscisymbiosum]|uniref:DUF5123 domain-containing protein n=1 Tax=Flavobacterium piscisymbiosum TaxID=2893753 RepID=A0ABS8M7Y8_9FLAO|nr:DUF5123 domain-containing protein [Flavobacterium sp. F-30]MCC9061589.1 DUF5123 domain-containing protein [Flavobacterium sp. F-30]
MKAKYIFKGLLAMFLLIVAGCESYNEAVLQDIGADRAFSPIELKAFVRNQTSVELNWTVKDDVDHYVVEFSADDTEFKTIYKTVNVLATELPVTIPLEGETVYSIRVKGVSATGAADSKWSIVTAKTLTEQILFPVEDIDVEAKQVTLRWTPNSTVTQISINPGNIVHTITPAEKTEGVAVITGLTGETDYTATLLNGTKTRGVRPFKTGIDIGTGILVKPTDDLNAAIVAAPAGSTLVLMPGDYQVFKGEIILDKGITIRGLRAGDKPKLSVRFTLNSSASSLSLIDLDLDGEKTQGDLVKINQAGTYGKIIVSGCIVDNYLGSFVIAPTGIAARVESITVDNCIVTDFGSGATGEFIDSRAAYFASIVITKSTFNNCVPGRAFIREDQTTAFGTGLTANILIDGCTFYKVTNTISAGGYQILYVRFLNNSAIVRNSIFAETIARYINQAATNAPAFSNNNYFNALTLNLANPTGALKSDSSGSALNPQFANAAGGDFTISNQTLKDNVVGDPRWIK